MKKLKIAVGITGASGSIYAKSILDTLQGNLNLIEEVSVVMSANALTVWEYELGNKDYASYPFRYFEPNDFFAPFASGSAGYDALIIAPCSMGTMGRIAAGFSDDLMTRGADVMLKERKKLVLLIRDSPYNHIHLKNMMTISEAGGILCPASPSFYSKPETFEQLAATVTHRAIQLAGLDISSYRWSS
jgi:4-hydroxy-3-polyprenylbenzoate decarboxylase